MSQDPVLKKEFQKKDVERIRNLVKGKYGEKTRESIGYTKAEEFHVEGETWISDGRTWTIRDGIKQNITKLDKAKKAYTMPLFCPKCKKIMDKRVDKPYYNIHKFCLGCYAKFTDKLKSEGKYEEYFDEINNKVLDQQIVDFKAFVKEKLEESNNQHITENGDLEVWHGKLNKEKVDEYTKSAVEYLESLKQ
ncbi:MAG: hypothetical protein H8E16_17965 [Flavobacteriales bacterium]|nr:hypothetical protein [Flavobacteriales bacterium]